MELFGVELLGINAETGHKILLSLAVLAVAIGARIGLGLLARLALKQHAPRGAARASSWAIASRWAGCAAT